MTHRRVRCGSAIVRKNQLVVVGGNNGSAILNSVELYNASTKTWTSLPPMATKRDGCAVTVVNDDLLVVLGGYDGNSYLHSVESFSFSTNTWSFLPSMSKRRWGCAAAAVGHLVYVVGGNDGNSSSLSSAEVLNIDGNCWSPIRSMNTKREGCALVALEDRHLYAIGGYSNSYLNSCEVYNISAGMWTACASMSLSRTYCAAVALDDKEILVVGGQHGRRGGGRSQSLNETETYHVETFRWTSSNVPAMGTRRRGCAAGLLPNKTVIVVGGSSGGPSLNTAETITLEREDVPTPPLLPPFPDSLVLPGVHNPRVSLRSLERWIDQVSQMKQTYQDAVSSATSRFHREFQDQRAMLEEELQRVEREHNHKLETLLSTSSPWLERIESRLEEAHEQLVQRQLELDDNDDDDGLLHTVPPDYSRMMLRLRAQEPPMELICPITLDLFQDPVVAADGHSYERFAIEKVFEQQQRNMNGQERACWRSPKTGQPLLTRTIFPNVALRTLCREFQQASEEAQAEALDKSEREKRRSSGGSSGESDEDNTTSRRYRGVTRSFEAVPY